MFRTLFSWANGSQRRESSHRKRETSTFRKRSLRLESLENRQLLSVNPVTGFEAMQSDPYPMTLEESIASSSIANTSSTVQAETAYAALVAENGEMSPNYVANSNPNDVLPVFWFDVNNTKANAIEGQTGTSAGKLQIYRRSVIGSSTDGQPVSITLKIQSGGSAATYGTNGDYTLRWSGNASSPNSSVAITEVNSNGEFTVTFGASSGLGILWIDAISDNLTEGPEFAFFEIVEDDSYEIMSVSQNDYVSVGEYSYTRTCFIDTSTIVTELPPPQFTSDTEWTTWDFCEHYYTGNGQDVSLANVGLEDNYRNAVSNVVNEHKQEARTQTLSDFTNGLMSSSYNSHKPRDVENDTNLYVLGNGLNVGNSNSTIAFSSESIQGNITTKYYQVTVSHDFRTNDAFSDPLSFQEVLGSSWNFNWITGGTPYNINAWWLESETYTIVERITRSPGFFM